MNPSTETAHETQGIEDAPQVTETAVAAPAPVKLGKEDIPTVLGKLRTLVQDKTRFEPHDITPLGEEDVLQDFSLQANYALEARFEQRVINGYFTPSGNDCRCGSHEVGALAHAQEKERLRRAAGKLDNALRQAGQAYNAIEAGAYLPHAVKYWHLDTCVPCSGKGRIGCHTCHGATTETCWNCHGGRTVSCDAYGCYGSGKVSCSYCSGSGTVAEQVTDYITVQVPTTTYSNGSSHTSYHSETRTQYRTEHRNCYHCSFGKVTCNTCHGSGNINCGTCRASGKVTCRTCSGAGDLRCNPCDGSGKVGTAAWVDVHVTPGYSVSLPKPAPDDARRIRDKESVHSLAAIASSLALAKVSIYNEDQPQEVDALYAAKLRIVRLDASCNAEKHHLVAYGTDLRWLTLDDIVEKLLRGDLKALSDALAGSADDGLFSAHVQGLLTPLRDVAASELNADVIESVLSGDADHAHVDVVSADYANNVRTCVLGALRQVYTRLAKQFWWKSALAALAAAIAAWFFAGRGAAAVAGLLVTGAGYWLFNRKVKSVLSEALGGQQQAARAMGIAGKGRRNQLAQVLILAPASVAVLAASYGLPVRVRPAAPPQQAAMASAPVAPHAPAAVPQDASAAKAVKLYENGDKAQALAMLESLVGKGDAGAYGLYGWMLLMGEGKPGPVTAPTAQQREARQVAAKPLVGKGLLKNDSYALTAKGVMLAEGWQEPRNMARGLDLLKQAANKGNAQAMHLLGLYHVRGYQIPVNHKEARKWFTLAADKGSAGDIYNLGLMDWEGAGLKRPDRASAMQRWKIAAAMGEERAIKAVAQGQP
ncbi:Sel1 repeat protein [Janthinobacterium sp. HH106]|uniref:tetratricopeptide repeat protein n=1 Tax=Janthinobacterium sp. HH106 TaxID=1537278 RepID=UPI000875726A|nr:tetratricopeptide repeat protein [Janthinobacterium sp. HH106]OEZ81423.1 Sel1 repeat protein [Janthinobacterium sp. HH106]